MRKIPIKLTDSQKIEVVSLYSSGKSCPDIAKIFNITPSSVGGILKRRGIQCRGSKKYKINESFFERIDTEDKAYFLGFLYADGYIDEKRGQVELSLQLKDKRILEQLSESMGSNKPLTFKKGKKHWRTGNMESDSYRLYIKNKKMANDLIKLEMRQNKSFTLQWPDFIKKSLIWHFIRGYFDGDGSICIKYNGQGTSYGACSMISSPDFINSANKFLTNEGFKCNIDDSKNKIYSQPMLILVINKIKDIQKFYDKLYCGTDLFLRRKKQKFEELFMLKTHLLEERSCP